MSGLTFGIMAPVRVPIQPDAEDAVALVVVGEKVLLALDETVDPPRIGAACKGKGFLGWLPADDSVVSRLLGGSKYQAEIGRIIRGHGERRFVRVDLYVTTT